MTTNNEHFKPSQVAELLCVSQRTLSRWHALRVGPSRVKVGRTILYRQAAVEAWLTANETQSLQTFQEVKA